MLAHLPQRGEVPHLDRLIQATADKFVRVRREGNTIDNILVPVGSLKFLPEVTALNVPNSHAPVKGARRHELGVGGDSDCRNAVIDSQRQVTSARLQIPDFDGSIAATRYNSTAVTGKVKRVNVLVVAHQGSTDLSCLDIPNLTGAVSMLNGNKNQPTKEMNKNSP